MHKEQRLGVRGLHIFGFIFVKILGQVICYYWEISFGGWLYLHVYNVYVTFKIYRMTH